MSYTPPIGNATTTTKGAIQLAGDLAGTSSSPIVQKINGTTISGTPTTGDVLKATGPSVASWRPPTADATTGLYLTPQQFGAKGDDTTDDTVALQNFFNAIFSGLEGMSKYGFIPAGTYKLTAPIRIATSQFAGARVEGAGIASVLKQYAGNASIIEFATTLYSHNFDIGHLCLSYRSPQTTLGNYAAIYMTRSGTTNTDGYFNQHFHHLCFINCSRGIATDPSIAFPTWGTSIDHCQFNGSNSGAFVYFFPNPAVGQPNISIKNCYCNGVGKAESGIIVSYCDNLVVENVEFNASNLADFSEIFLAQCNAIITACRSEEAKLLKPGTRGRVVIWEFSESQVCVQSCTVTGLNFDSSVGSTEMAILYNTGSLPWSSGTNVTMSVDGIHINTNNVGTNFYLASGTTCKMSLGSANLLKGCQKSTSGVTIVANPFGV